LIPTTSTLLQILCNSRDIAIVLGNIIRMLPDSNPLILQIKVRTIPVEWRFQKR
jgi:hypothetical protein